MPTYTWYLTVASNETAIDATVSPEPEPHVLPPPPAAAGSEVVAEPKEVRGRRRLKLVEDRTLVEVLEEGAERVEKLSKCFKDATDSGLFGREVEVTSCRCVRWAGSDGRQARRVTFCVCVFFCISTVVPLAVFAQ